MTYSLVNIATVVRDLARHPAGPRLALELEHVLALGPGDLARLDAAGPDPQAARLRDALLAAADARPRALELLGAGREAARSAGLAAWAASLDALEAAPVGGAVELVRWVRDELLAHAWDRDGEVAVARRPRAVDVVADGLLATWVQPDGRDEAVRLGRPWQDWVAARAGAGPPAAGDATPAGAVVAAVATASAEQLSAAGAAMLAQRATGWSWARAMHDACWAVELTGRGRPAATAQLRALRALLAVTGAPLLRADPVAAVTAAVHAAVVADVLPDETVAAMCRPLLTHLR